MPKDTPVYALILLSANLSAPVPPPIAEGDQVFPDFAFQVGGTLPLRIHYRTFGAPQRDARGRITNAVLLLHSTGHDGTQFLTPGMWGPLFGPGSPLDARRFYLIAPDGIGHGGSSKPSDGLGRAFPRYTYDDMVEAEHRLTAALGATHLRLVLGTSMGGMHAWLWGEKYPGEVDAIVPIAAVPSAITGRNLLWRRLAVNLIRHHPEAWPDLAPLFGMMTDSIEHLQQTIQGTAAADALVAQVGQASAGKSDDFGYALDASRAYDAMALLPKLRAKVLAIGFADDEVLPARLGLLEAAIVHLKDARAVIVPAGPDTRGHSTFLQGRSWAPELRKLVEATSSKP
jgi:homoserine O-acetyltransferase/O-succinyltransferase